MERARGRAPSSGDVFSVGLFAVDASAAAEVGELQAVIHNQNVLRFYIAVENAVPVHVVHRLDELIHVQLYSILGQVVASPGGVAKGG